VDYIIEPLLTLVDEGALPLAAGLDRRGLPAGLALLYTNACLASQMGIDILLLYTCMQAP
jgi:hypothetical protein